MDADCAAAGELVTAIVCTRNRGTSVVDTLTSILRSDHPRFEVVIVDQSTNDESERAVRAACADARLRYIRSDTAGLGRARNLGLSAATGEVCCFTDDDCTVNPGWLSGLAGVFAGDPKVAVAFCRVDAGPYDERAGFIPVYACAGRRVFTRVRDKSHARGIGAGIAVRRSAVLEMGGFDEMLGAGGVFPSCEDGDLAARALLLGYHVAETDEAAVTHFGFRTWEQGRDLSRRDWVGIGAAYVKPLRCGRWDFLPVVAREVFSWALWPPVRSLLMLGKPAGLSRFRYFLQGARLGWRTPIDSRTFLYRPDSRDEQV